MTEQLFPDDMANGLVDGTLPLDAVAADLRPVAEVLRAAHQPATAEELDGAAAMVQQFVAEVALHSTTARSSSMFATRLTRRAATMVAVTLLAAGTAAAAAGGALPSPFDSNETHSFAPRPEDDEVTTTESGETTTTTEAGEGSTTTEESTTTTEESTTTSSVELTDELMIEMRDENRSLKGKCTAWTNGAPKDPTVPGFVELQEAADEVGASIDDFCDAMLAAYDKDDADDDGDDESESGKDKDKGKGNGKGKGQGNGHGNGNESGNDD